MQTIQIPDDQKMLINGLINGACFCLNDDGMDLAAFSAFIEENYYLVPKQSPEHTSDMQSLASTLPDGTQWKSSDGLPINTSTWF